MKPLFTNVLQVGIVVKDVNKTLKTYADKYGIGPWSVYEQNKSNVESMRNGGKRVDYSLRVAVTNIGGVQMELIEPLDENSVHAQFLKEHGEGIHHLAVDTESYQSTVGFFEKNEIDQITYGNWLGTFGYDYRDTHDDLKIIVELHDPDPDFEFPEPLYVYPEKEMDRKPVFTDVLQVGIVVKDVNKTVKTYADKYGIGPWSFNEVNKSNTENMSNGGKRVDYSLRAAVTNIGGVQIELLEPLDENSVHAQFLKEHGEGIHHLALETESYQSTVEFFEKNEIGQVTYGNLEGMLRYDYRDTHDDLKCIVELLDADPDFEFPEPLYVYPEKNN